MNVISNFGDTNVESKWSVWLDVCSVYCVATWGREYQNPTPLLGRHHWPSLFIYFILYDKPQIIPSFLTWERKGNSLPFFSISPCTSALINLSCHLQAYSFCIAFYQFCSLIPNVAWLSYIKYKFQIFFPTVKGDL